MQRPFNYQYKETMSLGGLIFWAILLFLTTFWFRPDRLFTSDFLYFDQGVNMLVVNTILSGGMIYKDVAYPYGPLPAYFQTGAASIFGNGIMTYLGFLTVVCLLHLVLLYFTIKRFRPAPLVAVVCSIGFIPTMLIPATLFGNYTNAAYIPVERCLLTCLALKYQLPAKRLRRDALLLGGIMGAMQFTKFGGCFFAGIALILLDMLTLRIQSSGRADYLRWVRLSLITLAVFLVVEVSRIALAFTALPETVAKDVVWPAYTARFYDTLAGDFRWPVWVSARYFVGQQLTVFVGLVFSTAGLLRLANLAAFRHETVSRCVDDVPLLLLPLFYLLASVKYFGHIHLFYQYGWCLVFGVPYVITRVQSVRAIVVTALLLPCTLLMLKTTFLDKVQTALEVVPLPNGESLYCDPKLATATREILLEYQGLRTVSTAQQDRVLIYPLGAGYHVFFKLPRFSRHVWYIPHYIRPYDVTAMLESLAYTRAIVVYGENRSEDAIKFMNKPGVIPSEVADALRNRLGMPIEIGNGWWIIPVLKPAE